MKGLRFTILSHSLEVLVGQRFFQPSCRINVVRRHSALLMVSADCTFVPRAFERCEKEEGAAAKVKA